MKAFYNEVDTYCCDWLSNLMDAGHITAGVISDKSIEDIFPDELIGFDRCHFFAGIGVWDYALNIAGWGDRPVWTGSAPCQPFSEAGKGTGFSDERHLWPAWAWLIGELRPSVVFGEQVASKDIDPWIDLVQSDLEAMGYAIGCVPFPAAGIGAPHRRERAYFMAHAHCLRSRRNARTVHRAQVEGDRQGRKDGRKPDGSRIGRAASELEHAGGIGWERREAPSSGHDDDGPASERAQGEYGPRIASAHWIPQDGAGPANGFWRSADWLGCRDGKFRPVEPGTFPLVDGAPSRVGRLRAYGNAINAEAARTFIEAARDVIDQPATS